MRTQPPAGPAETDPILALAELLTHSARRLRRGSTAQLAPLGLTNAQARVLRMVASAGRPLRMADIAAALDVVPRSVTTMVDGVEAAGLIARHADPEDRRSVLVELTPKAGQVAGNFFRRTTAEEIFGSLVRRERVELARLLGALCHRGACSSCAGPPHHEHGPVPPGRSNARSRTHEGGA